MAIAAATLVQNSVRARISESTSADPGGLSSLQLATMALAAAVTAANLYYCQPLLSEIARSLHMTAREAADIPMLTQVGYALGLLLFAPLGDMVERRGLATALLLIVTVALVGTASAPDRWVLLATSLLTGIFSVVPQVMAPMALALSKPEAQGRVVGIVLGGMLIGILPARTVGLASSAPAFGWRAMYAGAGGDDGRDGRHCSRGDLAGQNRPDAPNPISGASFVTGSCSRASFQRCARQLSCRASPSAPFAPIGPRWSSF